MQAPPCTRKGCRCAPWPPDLREGLSVSSLPKHLEPLLERLCVGVYPAGICYADKSVQRNGDYPDLAFLPFRSLRLTVEPACPPDMKELIEFKAAEIQARRGQPFQISTCGQTVELGK